MIAPAHQYQREIEAFIERGLWSRNAHIDRPAAYMGWATEAEGLVVGLAFHSWQAERGSIEVSGYAARGGWLTRTVMAEIHDYLRDMAVRVLWARTSERNTRARRLLHGLGATEAVLPRMRGDNEDEIVAVLHLDDFAASRFKR